jgi:DNA-binding response OmpR family regulator/tRNA A-37 threonylcarbamoyl transferase component Bud32
MRPGFEVYMAKLLIIEDEPLMVTGLRDNFEYEGYEVIAAEDGSEGLKRAVDDAPDLVLLDVMLPKISGLDVCLKLKAKRPSIPIIMLTARCQVLDRVIGLELGADDYVTKPFSIRELSARVKALLRRVQSTPKNRYSHGSVCQSESHSHSRNSGANGKALIDRLRSIENFLWHRGDRVVDPTFCENKPPSALEFKKPACPIAEMSPVVEEDVCAMIGREVGHYRILSGIGRGGMGVVYMALDERLHRRVALKKLNAQNLADKRARIQPFEEAQNASFLNHPNICTIYDVVEVNDEIYMVMELVDGQPLSGLIGESGLPIGRVIHYATQIADALAHAHARGIIHGDLKSMNVVIRRDGLAKVLDFGLSTRIKDQAIDSITRSLGLQNSLFVAMGTIPYMAPEVLRGKRADACSDIWSFGVLLYESVSGALPFRGETAFSVSAAILQQAPAPLLERTPPKLRAVIERCLSKNVNQRYDRFDEITQQLRAIQHLA